MVSYALFEGRPLTTSGQWINPLVFAIHKFGAISPFHKKVEKPIFILGTGRSGTTILGIGMSMHKDCAFLNEPKALWHSVFPFEDLIGSYTRGDAWYELDETMADEASIKKIRNIFGFYLNSVFSKRLVDKYPELIFRIDFIKKIFPDFKALFIYRNGWDTCISSAGWSDSKGKVKGEEQHDWWGADNRKWNLLVEQIVAKDDELSPHINEIRNFTDQFDKSVVEWIVSMKRGLLMAEKYPQHILKVRYESLVNDSDKTLHEICNFCELPFDEKQLKYAKATLEVVPHKKQIPLHPLLEKPFNELMKKLNY